MPTLIVIIVVAIIAGAIVCRLLKIPSAPADSGALQNDAKRFARLLVAEIKLYNEPKIERVRRAKDIYSQLKDEIDEARRKYDKRIDRNLTDKDYFDETIIKQLADGDAGRMGAQYTQSKIH